MIDLEHLLNNTDGTVIVVFGFLTLPKSCQIEVDAIQTIIGIMTLLGILSNATLLSVIIKDPFKQLRTNTAILVGFNAFTNVTITLCMCLERILIWCGREDVFTPQLIIYLGSCNINMFFIGNLLHALNLYGTIVIPLRYNRLAPTKPKKVIIFVGVLWLINACVFMVIPYVIPSSKIPHYIEGILTSACVIIGVLTLVFIGLYIKIFGTLYARKKRLASFHVQHSRRGIQVVKQNYEVAKTLFIHITCLVLASCPGIIVFMLALHCSQCNFIVIQRTSLFVFPLVYTLFLSHPILWLYRMGKYRQALKQILGFKIVPKPKPSVSNRTEL